MNHLFIQYVDILFSLFVIHDFCFNSVGVDPDQDNSVSAFFFFFRYAEDMYTVLNAL